MIWQDIVEARRNPDKNDRQHIITELSKYQGQSDVFVSFTSGFTTHTNQKSPWRSENIKHKGGQNKIGINPKSSFFTPLGIYTYPIDYIIEWSKDNGKIGAPFTGREAFSSDIM